MSIELIKNKHLPVAVIALILGFIPTWYFSIELKPLAISAIDFMSYPAVLIAVGGLGVFAQIFENKYVWGKLLNLEDNISFLGLSIGFTIGFIGLGRW